MNRNASRKMTMNERLYTIAEKLAPPFALQFIIEGEGRIDANQLREAVINLAEQLPAMRLKLTGKTWRFDGHLPEVIEHDEDISLDFSTSLFKDKLDPYAGKCMEIHLFHGESTAILFRVLHSIVDGKGAQIILYALFALMRNETIELNPEFASDMEVRQSLTPPENVKREGYQIKWPGFALPKSNPIEFISTLMRFEHRVEAPIAKCGTWFVSQMGESARMLIPVDIRRHEAVDNMASNLSLPIYLTIHPDQKWQEVQGNLLADLAANKELAAESMEGFGVMAPQFILEGLLKYVIKRGARKKRYPMSGVLSDMGFWELELVSVAGFSAKDISSIPVYVPMAPFCVDIVHHSGGTRLGVSLPAGTDLRTFVKNLSVYVFRGKTTPKLDKGEEKLDKELAIELQKLWAQILEKPIDMIDPKSTFHQLGGDSIKLLFMLTEVSEKYIKYPESDFMTEALSTGGHISIESMIGLMETTPVNNK